MIRWLAGGLLFAAFAAAPAAAADPEDLLPGCGSGQVPAAGECIPVQPDVLVEEADAAGVLSGPAGALGGIPGAFPGANPNIPLAPLPFNFPAVIPLGVTPFQIPSNLPLGPTPPTRFPFAP